LFWYQEALSNPKLLILGITTNLNYLHAVAQRPRDGIELVCRSNKHHLRQIVRDLKVVIRERRVLLWVQHLKQCRGWIATEILAYFIDLIQNVYRVARFCRLHTLDNAARHCTNVRASVTTNLSLIADTAQAGTHETAVECAGNRATQ